MDRDKVIKGLECLAQKQEPMANPCKGCGYIDKPNFAICVKDVASDALDLLKEQEPKAVILKNLGAYCPWCSTGKTIEMGVMKLHLGTHFCPYCGQAVKWE